MSEKISYWIKFKRFLKRNMTPTWFKHISYQIFAFIVSVLMIVGVAEYAVAKTYDEMELIIMNDFTITAHTGAYNTPMNSVASVEAAIANGAKVIELDVRRRPNGTIVMAHDIAITNKDGTDIREAFALLVNTDIKINLDIKETRVLDKLYTILVDYSLVDQAFLTGIETADVKAVRESSCAELDYYLNYTPSRTKIFMDDYRQKLISMLDETGAVGINCNYKFASAQLSNLLHTKGYKLSVWTIDTERKAKKMLVCKPDNITTKNPDMIQKVIENWGK